MAFSGSLIRGTLGRRFGVLGALAGLSVAYYIGGYVGLQLRMPSMTPSVMWPPNAILTSALLVTPVRYWGLCLGAALPAHLIAQLPTDWPLALILLLFVTNCSEALLAAGGMRLLSDAPERLDTLRRLRAFLLACVIVAPLLSTFLDAAAVTWLRGEPYGIVWRNRFFSNVLAQLTVVPAMVGIVVVWRSRHHVALYRLVEATLFCCGLALTAWLMLQRSFDNAIIHAMSSQTPLALQLPFILWAALRFRSTGTSLALLATTVPTSWAAVHGRGPFQGLLPDGTVVALQLILIVVAVTLLILATVIEERRRTAHALGDRLEFEALLSRLSAEFVHLSSDRMEAAFESWLERLGMSLGVDCLRLFRLDEETGHLHLMSAWAVRKVDPPPALVMTQAFPWTQRQILHRNLAMLQSRATLPAEAALDRASLEEQGFLSALVMPLVAGDRLLGAMGFGSVGERSWPDTLVTNLRLVSEVFANSLVRKQAEDQLRANEVLKSAILESLTSGVAVIDRVGRVRALNENWRLLERHNGGLSSMAVQVGDNLLERSRAAADHGDSRFGKIVEGMGGVLDGTRERFMFEYVSQAGDGSCWWVLLAVRLKGPDGGAVVTCADITERRRAEVEAQRSRQDLAHVTRVSTMGALGVSLAHQLNQPLTGIMANAQAASRLLASAPFDVGELQAILADIVDDNRRASEVIRGLREFLRKGDARLARVDLGAAIREVATLVESDAVIRNVAMVLDLESEPVFVMGDRVQLQQVVLNLIVNALEALNGAPAGERTVAVHCRRLARGQVQVTVHDSGVGLDAHLGDFVFEPFYTTKPGGMGMGLSIARSIVEAHGGTIRARSQVQRGAAIEFTLPMHHREDA